MKISTTSLVLAVILIGLFVSVTSAKDDVPDIAVTTLDLDDVRWRNYRYIGDILALIPGVWIRDIDEIGNWSTASLRGGEAAHTRILIDGRPLDEPWTGSTDLNLIPVEMVLRIEVHHGPNPFDIAPAGGVVNLVTRDVPSPKPYSRIVYRSVRGSFGDTDVTFGQKISEHTEIMTGVLLKNYGDFDADYRSYEGQTIRAKLKTRLFSKIDLGYAILNHKGHLDPPFAQVLPDSDILIASAHRHRKRTDHRLTAAWDFLGMRSRLHFDHTPDSFTIWDRNASLESSFQVRSTAIRFNNDIELGKMNLAWGVDVQMRRLKTDSLTHDDAATGLFIRNDLPVGKRMINTLQARWHRAPGGASRLLFQERLSASLGRRFGLWAGYAEGLRDPSLGERFGMPFYPAPPKYADELTLREQAAIASNESLKPELARSIELGVRLSPLRRIEMRLRGYLKTISDLIHPALHDGTYRFENGGKYRFSGADASLALGPWLGFRSNVTLNVMRAVDAEDETLLERPSFWTNAAIGWNHAFFQGDLDVTLSVGMRYHSGFWTLTGESSDEAALGFSEPGPIIDVKAFIIVITNVTFTFAFDNVTDAQIHAVGMQPGNGRTFRLGIAWNLYD